MNRREKMIYLRERKPEKKWTYREIGFLFDGISRQRVHQIVSNSKYKGISGRPQRNPVGSVEL